MMKTLYRKILLLVVLTLATVQPAYAAEPMKVARWYKVYWMGMYVGDLVSQIKENPDGSVAMESHINARGMAKKISKYWSVTHSKSLLTPEGIIQPASFEIQSKLRSKERKTNLFFAEGMGLAGEQIVPPENKEKRPPVPMELKANAVDPHTAALIAHQKIRSIVKNGGDSGFKIPLYDGRRRFDLYVTVLDRKTIEVKERTLDTVHISLRREAIAGFTKKELANLQEEDPVIDVYLSDDHLLLPVAAKATAPIGEAIAVLERECYDVESCESTPETYEASAQIKW